MGTEDYFDRATGSFNPPFLCIITYNRLSFYTLKNEDPASEVLCNVYTVVVVSGVSQTDGRWSPASPAQPSPAQPSPGAATLLGLTESINEKNYLDPLLHSFSWHFYSDYFIWYLVTLLLLDFHPDFLDISRNWVGFYLLLWCPLTTELELSAVRRQPVRARRLGTWSQQPAGVQCVGKLAWLRHPPSHQPPELILIVSQLSGKNSARASEGSSYIKPLCLCPPNIIWSLN